MLAASVFVAIENRAPKSVGDYWEKLHSSRLKDSQREALLLWRRSRHGSVWIDGEERAAIEEAEAMLRGSDLFGWLDRWLQSLRLACKATLAVALDSAADALGPEQGEDWAAVTWPRTRFGPRVTDMAGALEGRTPQFGSNYPRLAVLGPSASDIDRDAVCFKAQDAWSFWEESFSEYRARVIDELDVWRISRDAEIEGAGFVKLPVRSNPSRSAEMLVLSDLRHWSWRRVASEFGLAEKTAQMAVTRLREDLGLRRLPGDIDAALR